MKHLSWIQYVRDNHFYQAPNHPSLHRFKKPAHLQCALQNNGHSGYVQHRLQSITASSVASFSGDQDLAKFLKDEIATEKQNSRSLPKLSGWAVKTDGSEVCNTHILSPPIVSS